MSAITRREALARVAALAGGLSIAAQFALSAGAREAKKTARAFSEAEIGLMDEIGDTIIPATDTPGAKAAGIGRFMAMMVADCFDEPTEAQFRHGLAEIDAMSRTRSGRPFVESSPKERLLLIEELDRLQHDYMGKKTPAEPPHYFRIMKELTLVGYFSSEIGCTQELRYVEIPGAYRGDVPYKKGEKAWFDASSPGARPE